MIVAIDGQKLGSASELTRTVAMKKPGTVTTLTLYRGGKKLDVKVTLAQRPKDEVASADDLGGDEGGGEQNQKQVGLAFRDADPRTMQALGIDSRAGGALITDVTPGSAGGARRAGPRDGRRRGGEEAGEEQRRPRAARSRPRSRARPCSSGSRSRRARAAASGR